MHFLEDGAQFTLVVEPQDEDAYRHVYSSVPIIVLPEDSRGVAHTRQLILEYARENSIERYWQIDDNITAFFAHSRGKLVQVYPTTALRIVEDEAQHLDASIAAPNFEQRAFRLTDQPVQVGTRCVCCVLTSTNTGIDYDERFLCSEDADFSVAHIFAGFTVALCNHSAFRKNTMGGRGGLSSVLSSREKAGKQDGELLEQKWPGFVRHSTSARHLGGRVVLWSKLREVSQR